MHGIIIDTSSILFGLSNKVDAFKKVEEQLNLSPIISKGVLNELTEISKSRKSASKYAKVALLLIERHGIRTEENDAYVDKWILSSAKAFGSVCTNDTNLKKALRARGITVYSISRDGILR